MNRIGWIFLALLAAVVGGFLFMVHPAKWSKPASRTQVTSETNVDTGDLLIPVAGVSRAMLVDSYTDPRAGGTRDHRAIDILAPLGTPVVAASAGRVEKIFESAEGGHTVYIRRNDGKQSYYYAHLDRYAPGLREGQPIAQGDMIGFVGTTGNADPGAPHLHFAVHNMAPTDKWHEGTPVDPYPYLAGKAPSR